MPERCDGVDEDCDGVVDDDAIDAVELFPDRDGDGFGTDEDASLGCPRDRYVAVGGDCDDADDRTWPRSPAESCRTPNLDRDCDGVIPGRDVDGDGANACVDCDDADADVNPRAIDVPGNGVDEDCDGADAAAMDPPETGGDTDDRPEPGCGGCDAGGARGAGGWALLVVLAVGRRRRVA